MFFRKKYTIHCNRSRDEIIHVMDKVSCSRNKSNDQPLTFRTRLHPLGFVLWRKSDRFNPFAPRVCGSFGMCEDGRCKIGLTMRLHRLHRWLMLLTYLVWAGSLATVFLINRRPLYVLIIFMLPFPLLLMGYLSFSIDARRRARKIRRMTRGELVSHGPS